jgi:hypothetical protein
LAHVLIPGWNDRSCARMGKWYFHVAMAQGWDGEFQGCQNRSMDMEMVVEPTSRLPLPREVAALEATAVSS